jgi:hypothetical protein
MEMPILTNQVRQRQLLAVEIAPAAAILPADSPAIFPKTDPDVSPEPPG